MCSLQGKWELEGQMCAKKVSGHRRLSEKGLTHCNTVVSYRCCDRRAQGVWLKRAWTYHLILLEVTSLKWVSRAACLLGALEENISLPFLVSKGCLLSLAVAPHHSDLHFGCHISSLPFLPPSSILKVTHDYIEPTNEIPDNLPISRPLIIHAYRSPALM